MLMSYNNWIRSN